MKDASWITVGTILRSHGLKGGLKVSVSSDNPDRFRVGENLWLCREKRAIQWVKPLNRALVLGLDGIASPEEAEQYRNENLEVPGESLPALAPGRYYCSELAGMRAISLTGAPLGEVEEATSSPGTDMLRVRLLTGKEFLFPMTPQVLHRVDREPRVVILDTDPFSEFPEIAEVLARGKV